MSQLDTRINPHKPELAASHLKGKVEAKKFSDAVRHQVMLPVVPVHKSPTNASMMDTQLLLGSKFDIYDIQNGWAWGQEVQEDGSNKSIGYVGYVPNTALAHSTAKPTHRVSVIRAPVFVKPDLKTAIRTTLPLNAKLVVGERVGDYVHIPDTGYVHINHLSKTKDATGDFVSIAKLHLGLPYIWGGISPDGVDCSGLVQTALRAVGKDAPRDTDLQEASLGVKIEEGTELKRGDLVFWKGHVGILQDANTLLHANAYHMLVASEPLANAIARIAKTAGPVTSIKRI